MFDALESYLKMKLRNARKIDQVMCVASEVHGKINDIL
jgi:hypothetical protein